MLSLADVKSQSVSGLGSYGDPTTLNNAKKLPSGAIRSRQLIEITVETLKTNSPRPAEISGGEKLKRNVVAIIESNYTLGAIGLTYVGALAVSLAASILSYVKRNSDNCPRPAAPLVLDVASAVTSLISAGMELLGSFANQAVEEDRREEALVAKFVEALESRQKKTQANSKQASNEPQNQEKELSKEIEECISYFNALPQHLKNELPPIEQWILWLVNTLPEDHPLKTSQDQFPNSGTFKEPPNDSVSGIVERIVHEATVTFTSHNTQNSKQTINSNGHDEFIVEIAGDKILELNKRKLNKGLNKPDPERLKIEYVQAQAKRVKELEAQRMAQNPGKPENYCITLIRSPYRRLVEQTLLGGSILLSGASSIADLVLNNDNNCDRPASVLGLSAASIGMLSVVAFVWISYLSLKTSLGQDEHDGRLIEKFLKAVEEQADGGKCQSEDQVENLHEKIQGCLKLFDQLPSEAKQRLFERDLWIMGLLNALPESHPIQQEVTTLSKKLTKPRRECISKEPLSRIPTMQLQEQLDSLFKMVEDLVGGPVKYIAVGDYCITRNYEIKKFEDFIKVEKQNGAVKIGMGL